MEIQSLIRERVVANIKIGKKGKNGIPQKLAYFNVEEDKVTSKDIVDVFKQKYSDKPTKLNIRFTSENPFSFNFKKYVNGKAICIGNGEKAITVGKDAKNNNTQIEIECSEECENRQNGKCKLKGNLKFILDGIDAGGVFNLSTSGGFSLSNIASEIVANKRAGLSIVGVPFELTLTEQESLAYGTYYSINLHRTDMKPKLVEDNTAKLPEGKKEDSKKLNDKPKQLESPKEKEEIKNTNETEKEKKDDKMDFSKVCMIDKIMPTIVNGKKFNKIIFTNANNEKVEYLLHPKADQKVLSIGIGSCIYVTKTMTENEINILCTYDIKQVMQPDGKLVEYKEEKIKEAV